MRLCAKAGQRELNNSLSLTAPDKIAGNSYSPFLFSSFCLRPFVRFFVIICIETHPTTNSATSVNCHILNIVDKLLRQALVSWTPTQLVLFYQTRLPQRPPQTAINIESTHLDNRETSYHGFYLLADHTSCPGLSGYIACYQLCRSNLFDPQDAFVSRFLS
jgi:hypothetical protein